MFPFDATENVLYYARFKGPIVFWRADCGLFRSNGKWNLEPQGNSYLTVIVYMYIYIYTFIWYSPATPPHPPVMVMVPHSPPVGGVGDGGVSYIVV